MFAKKINLIDGYKFYLKNQFIDYFIKNLCRPTQNMKIFLSYSLGILEILKFFLALNPKKIEIFIF